MGHTSETVCEKKVIILSSAVPEQREVTMCFKSANRHNDLNIEINPELL